MDCRRNCSLRGPTCSCSMKDRRACKSWSKQQLSCSPCLSCFFFKNPLAGRLSSSPFFSNSSCSSTTQVCGQQFVQKQRVDDYFETVVQSVRATHTSNHSWIHFHSAAHTLTHSPRRRLLTSCVVRTYRRPDLRTTFPLKYFKIVVSKPKYVRTRTI